MALILNEPAISFILEHLPIRSVFFKAEDF